MSDRARIENDAALFIMRRGEPDWSVEDAQALEEWLAASAGHRAAFLRIEHSWGMADRLRALNCPSKPIRMRSWVTPHMLAIAASVVLAVAIGVSFIIAGQHSVEQQHYATEIGERDTVRLVDGSSVELNTNTHIRALLGKGKREIWLDRGEAYFQVAHDSEHPFVVHLGTRDVVVLGTRFSIRRDPARLTIAVVEGAVRLGGTRPDRLLAPTVLRRGDLAVAEGTSMLVNSQALDLVEQATRWRDGNIVFDNQRLGDVLQEFNRYSRRRLITDPASASLRITGSLRADNAEGLVRLARDIYHVEITYLPDSAKISRDEHTDF